MDIPYCVILRTGPNEGKKQFFSAPADKVEYMFNGCAFDVEGRCNIEMRHLARNPRGKASDMIKINKNLRTFVLEAQNEQTANKCLGYYGINAPFSEN